MRNVQNSNKTVEPNLAILWHMGALKRVRRATPSIVPRFYLTRRQPWHASSASRTCCCATFHTRPSSARAALADPSRTASERELATDSRTALANHVAIPVLLTQPHIEAGQSQVDGVEAVSKHPGPSPCSPRRRRWLAPPPVISHLSSSPITACSYHCTAT